MPETSLNFLYGMDWGVCVCVSEWKVQNFMEKIVMDLVRKKVPASDNTWENFRNTLM